MGEIFRMTEREREIEREREKEMQSLLKKQIGRGMALMKAEKLWNSCCEKTLLTYS